MQETEEKIQYNTTWVGTYVYVRNARLLLARLLLLGIMTMRVFFGPHFWFFSWGCADCTVPVQQIYSHCCVTRLGKVYIDTQDTILEYVLY